MSTDGGFGGWGTDNGGDYSGSDSFDGPGDASAGLAGWGLEGSQYEGSDNFDAGGGWSGVSFGNNISAPSLSGMNDFGLSNMDSSAYGAPDFGGSYGVSDFSSMAEPSFFDQLGRFKGLALGLVGRANPTLGSFLGMANRAHSVGTSQTRGQAMGQFGSIAGGVLGSVFGGPLGGMAGSQLGGMAGRSMGGTGGHYSGP
ncbi:MAG: hypothetical protein ACRCVT_06490, partial [Leadbetterella sp.]